MSSTSDTDLIGMADPDDLGAIARSIVDSNRYMTLATADEHGMPWASPVWYAPEEYRALLGLEARGQALA